MSGSITWSDMEDLLIRLGDALEEPTKLVVIGSMVSMSLGQVGRMTLDIDVWRNTSQFDSGILKKACHASGIAFNPVGIDEPQSAYIQLISPGIDQLGAFMDTTPLFKSGNLEIAHPPLANVIASKMVRGEPQDYEDCVFLMHKCRVNIPAVELAIASIEDEMALGMAMENLTLLTTCLDAASATAILLTRPFSVRSSDDDGPSI